MEKANGLKEDIDEAFDDKPSFIKKREKSLSEDTCEECIFGFEFFTLSPTTFTPTSNVPVPSNYSLGPGDKLEVTYYGNEELKESLTISREGLLLLPILGPINLMGVSFDKAIQMIDQKVNNELIGTEVAISISDVRSINIFVLGEAHQPGVYTMSGLSSITSALFVSGGVNESGSLREIEVKRNGKTIAQYDFYKFLLYGETDNEVRLENGDVIFIPFIENKVLIGGDFKRPHLYEFKEGETLSDAVNLAGGFKSEISPARIELSTISSDTKTRILKYLDNNNASLSSLSLKNGDMVNASGFSGIKSKSVQLSGEVENPGTYSLLENDTILDVINRAGGYRQNAYPEGAIYLRKSVAKSQKVNFIRSADELEKTILDIISKGVIEEITDYTFAPFSVLIQRLREEDPLGRMVVDVDKLKLKTDPNANFKVQDGDSLFIPTRPDTISVVGEVLNTTTLAFNSSLDSFDYIDLSGGLSDSADENKIFIIYPDGKSRLIKKKLFAASNLLLPGSTIVVSRSPRAFDAISLTQIITPILADLATSAAAIAAISNN
jgi:protein involved in polysaccharide export with SLBB domain